MTVKEPIKKLPVIMLADIKEKNEARAAVGLSPLKIVVRRCLRCEKLFESTGNRTCGCSVLFKPFVMD